MEPKRTLLALAALLLCTAASLAQTLEGQIVDPKKQPIGFATVTLLAADSTFLAGTTCDAEGRFVLPEKDNASLIKVSFVGFKTLTLSINNEKLKIKNGNLTLQMEEESQELQEVEVVSMRQLVKMDDDRLSYNMEADPESKTKQLMDMLKKVPLVSVEGDGTVRVQGSTSFKYYKNGHYDPTLSGHPKEVLKSIPAHMVKRVEVITEPGARYDAEGVTAILNIVMHSSRRLTGINGSISGNINNWGTWNGGAWLAGQAQRLTVSGMFYYNDQAARKNREWGDAEQIFVQSGDRKTVESVTSPALKGIVSNLEASFEIDSLNLLSGSFQGFHYKTWTDSYHKQAIFDAEGTLTSSYDATLDDGKSAGITWDGRLDYEHRTRLSGEVLTLSYLFSTTGNDNDKQYWYENRVAPTFDFTGYRKWSKERFTEHTVQADYIRPLWERHQLEVGGKFIARLNRSHTIMTYNEAAERDIDSRFRHDTQVAAAYASWRYSVGKLTFRAGLRYELARLEAKYPDGEASNFHSTLGDLVPSASLLWRLTPYESLRFSYSTSISRPGISYLNPARQASASSVYFGNPGLKSSRNTMIGVTYQRIGNRLTVNIRPNIRLNNNAIGKQKYTVDDIIYSTFANDNHDFQARLNAYIQWQATKTTSIMLSSSAGYWHRENPSLGIENSTWSGYYTSVVNQKLPWEIEGSLSVNGNFGHGMNGIYGHTGHFSPTVNINFQRSLLKDKRLTVGLHFLSITSKHYSYDTFTTQGDYREHNRYANQAQAVMLVLSYRFGKSKTNVKKTEKTIENNDVEGGLSKGTN